MLIRILIKLSSLLLVLAIKSMAGGGIDGGGGMVFTCPTSATNAEKVFLVDTYKQLKSSEKLKISDPGLILRAAIIFFKNHPSKIFKDAVFMDPRNSQDRVSLSWLIEYKNNNLIFSPSTESLPLLGDDHIEAKDIPNGCQKRQLAIQKISAGNILYDQKLESKLTFFESGFFRLHEILISIRNSPGLDTTEIREEIDALLSENLESFQKALIDIIPLIIPRSERTLLFEDSRKDLCHTRSSSFSNFNLSKQDLINSAICNFYDKAIHFQTEILPKPLFLLKVLKSIPAQLLCRVTAVARNDFNYQEKLFTVNKAPNPSYTNEFLYVDKQQRVDYESSVAKFRFSLSWNNLTTTNTHSLIVENYSENANEFYGNLYLTNEKDPQKLSHLGVACQPTSKEVLFNEN